ncbi:hypothetical protein IFR05_013753 [Cadophora sp. M221]|nr:hypothetical protein IFR05_013753 [Cadophora sp. M221]
MAWSPLRLSPSAGAHLPSLLICTTFTASSFAVHLTDLTYIWSESVNRAAIVQRSREEATSIDPSEEGQLKIFLEKLKLGLAGGKGTTLALTINGDPDRPSLVLRISVDLPGRLAALQWPVRLAAAPQALLTSHLTVPLLQTRHAQLREKGGLVDVLKDKDHVIQKLLDKLEEQNTDLGQIFPQAAGKVGRKVDRKKAEDKVRGIARFDMDAWRKGFSHDQPEDTSKLIGEVFAEQTDFTRNVIPATSDEQESWWEDIKGLTVHLDSGKISTEGPLKNTKPKPQPTPRNQNETQAEDDAFQTQSTPPPEATTSKSTLSKPLAKSTKLNDSTDDDDEDLDAPSQRSRVPDSLAASLPPSSPKPANKLGTIGNKKAARQPTSPPLNNNDGDDDEESTADESISPKPSSPKQNDACPSPSPAPDPIPVPHRPQNKLGKVGGRKPTPAPATKPELDPEPEPERKTKTKTKPKNELQPSSSSSTEEDGVEEVQEKAPSRTPTPPPAASKAKKGKLGRIGGKKKASTPTPFIDEQDPEQEPVANPDLELELETSPDPKTAPPKRKLGALGGNKKSKSISTNRKEDGVKEEDDDEGGGSQRGRGRVGESSQIENQEEEMKMKTPELEPEKRETSLERADRKRDALKRELEEKAKAPVKKKRKF